MEDLVTWEKVAGRREQRLVINEGGEDRQEKCMKRETPEEHTREKQGDLETCP